VAANAKQLGFIWPFRHQINVLAKLRYNAITADAIHKMSICPNEADFNAQRLTASKS